MIELIELIDNIRTTKSRSRKEELMIAGLNSSEYFREILLYTYEPLVDFKISKKVLNGVKNYTHQPAIGYSTFKDFKTLIENLKDAPNDMISLYLEEFSFIVGDEWGKLYKKILSKNLDCGVGESIVNKLLPLKKIKIMKATPYTEGCIDFENNNWFLEPKIVGQRSIAILDEGSCNFYTPNNVKIKNIDKLEIELLQLWVNTPRLVLDGTMTYDNKFIISDAIPYQDFFEGVCEIKLFNRRRILDRLPLDLQGSVEVSKTFRATSLPKDNKGYYIKGYDSYYNSEIKDSWFEYD